MIADEVRKKPMYTQMIIGLARLQMEVNLSVVLILAESMTAILGAFKTDQREFVVKRYYLSRSISSLEICPGKPQMRALANLLIRWQESGHTKGLEVMQMSSGEDPDTWSYFDLPVKAEGAMGKKLPYYLHPQGIEQKRPHVKDDVPTHRVPL